MHFLEGSYGIKIVEFFQSGLTGEILSHLLLPFHYLGSEMGYLTLLPIIYWSVNKKLGKELIILVLCSTIFTNLLKGWWKRPRPFHISPDKITPLEVTSEFGLPSGHTIFGTVLGLSLVKFSKKQWQFIFVLLFILLMGVSRLVHGMHFLQDVVLGWILGLLFFFLFTKVKSKISVFFNRLNLFWQITLSAIFVFVVFIVFVLVGGDFEYKKSLLSPLGGLLGSFIGIFIETKYIEFADVKRIKTKIIRIITGLISLIVLYILLNKIYYSIVGKNQSVAILFLYLIRYGILGFWIIAGVPFLFKKFKLN